MLPKRVESTDCEPVAEATYNPEAWVHPIVVNDIPQGIIVDQGYNLGLRRLEDLTLRKTDVFEGKKVKRAPLPLRRLRHTNPIFPQVIVFRRKYFGCLTRRVV